MLNPGLRERPYSPRWATYISPAHDEHISHTGTKRRSEISRCAEAIFHIPIPGVRQHRSQYGSVCFQAKNRLTPAPVDAKSQAKNIHAPALWVRSGQEEAANDAVTVCTICGIYRVQTLKHGVKRRLSRYFQLRTI